MITPDALDYFTNANFLRLDVAKGTLRSPGGTRMLGVSEDFLRGFVEACEYEAGPATPGLLRRCGEFFGRRLARWFERELSQAAVSLRERTMIEYSTLLHDMARGLSLGVLAVDWRHGARGLLSVSLSDSAMSTIALQEHVGEDMFEGLFEGFFSSFSELPLRCLQTGDARLGDAPGTTFLVGPEPLIERARALRAEGATHDAVVAALVEHR